MVVFLLVGQAARYGTEGTHGDQGCVTVCRRRAAQRGRPFAVSRSIRTRRTRVNVFRKISETLTTIQSSFLLFSHHFYNFTLRSPLALGSNTHAGIDHHSETFRPPSGSAHAPDSRGSGRIRATAGEPCPIRTGSPWAPRDSTTSTRESAADGQGRRGKDDPGPTRLRARPHRPPRVDTRFRWASASAVLHESLGARPRRTRPGGTAQAQDRFGWSTASIRVSKRGWVIFRYSGSATIRPNVFRSG